MSLEHVGQEGISSTFDNSRLPLVGLIVDEVDAADSNIDRASLCMSLNDNLGYTENPLETDLSELVLDRQE